MTLSAARRAQVLGTIRESSSASVADLSRHFGVSEMTIRRDLDVLSSAGELMRVHGGAMALQSSYGSARTMSRPTSSSTDLALANAAYRMVRPRSTIALTPGTATYALARRVATVPSVNVVTNSVWVADMLHAQGRGAATLLTGGLGTSAGGLVGPCVANTLRGLRVDILFMEVEGIDSTAGLSTGQFADAAALSAFIDAAHTVVVLTPSARWATVRLCTIAALEAVDTLVTDRVTMRMQAEIGRKIPHIVCVRKPDTHTSTTHQRPETRAELPDRRLA